MSQKELKCDKCRKIVGGLGNFKGKWVCRLCYDELSDISQEKKAKNAPQSPVLKKGIGLHKK